MPRFELTHFVTSLQKRRFQVEAADTATARERVLKGCSHGVIVGRETVLFRTPLDCKEIAATAAPTNVKAATDPDGCPIWVPVSPEGDDMLGEVLIALTVLTLLCLYGSGDRTGPYETHHYTQQDDDFHDE